MIRIDKMLGYLRQTWCVAPEVYEGALQAAALFLSSGRVADSVKAVMAAEPQLVPAAQARARTKDRMDSVYSVEPDGLGIIRVAGVIGKGLSDDEVRKFGMVDVDDVSAAFRMAKNDSSVRAILMDADSPGGTITGVPELANDIRAARAVKPVMAYTDTMACSAMYWLCGQCSAIYASKTAAVASVGVYIPVLDLTGLYDKLGLKMDVISSGDLKAMGYPGTTLTEKQRAYLQDRVTATHDDFKDAVRNVRGNISDEYFRGQAMYADEAKKGGLLDDLSDFDTARRDALSLKRG